MSELRDKELIDQVAHILIKRGDLDPYPIKEIIALVREHDAKRPVLTDGITDSLKDIIKSSRRYAFDEAIEAVNPVLAELDCVYGETSDVIKTLEQLRDGK